MPRTIDSLSTVTDDYPYLLCDVWGVVHDGVEPYRDGCEALRAARKRGCRVVLVTNSPRLSDQVVDQMRGIGVPDDAYDGIVTSGDVTRTLIAEGPRRIFHIGTPDERTIVDGLDVVVVGEKEAQIVLCSGLSLDLEETVEDYRPLLERLAGRGLPMICANPDLKVRRGDRVVPCAGALAALYADLGQSVAIAGKPHRPIYDAALRLLSELSGSTVDRGQCLAIGDGVPTDIKGAADYGLDCLFISGGEKSIEEDDPFAVLARAGYAPVAAMVHLA